MVGSRVLRDAKRLQEDSQESKSSRAQPPCYVEEEVIYIWFVMKRWPRNLKGLSEGYDGDLVWDEGHDGLL